MNLKIQNWGKYIISWILLSFLSFQIMPPTLTGDMEICRYAKSNKIPNFNQKNVDITTDPCCKTKKEILNYSNTPGIDLSFNKKIMNKVLPKKTCCPDKCDEYSFSCCIQILFVFLQNMDIYSLFSRVFFFMSIGTLFILSDHKQQLFRPPRKSVLA